MLPAPTGLDPAHREQDFISQSGRFAELLLETCGVRSLAELAPLNETPAQSLPPVMLDDYRRLTNEERASLRRAYHSERGVAYFIALNPKAPPRGTHPLFDITEQLAEDLHLIHPLPHPLEGHAEAVERFGPADGTVKIYDLPGRGGRGGLP